MTFHHISVFLQEAVTGLNIKSNGIYVDCTLGGAGHSGLIAEKLSTSGHLIGIDQDELAITNAGEKLYGIKPRLTLVHDNFSNLANILEGLAINNVDGVLMDLGISSPQIDLAERGFSYMQDAKLDMRMDRRQALSAETVVNNYSVEELARIFYEYGEERWAKRIAKFIAEAREKSPLVTTGEIVGIIDKAIPYEVRQKQEGHPAKRVFQALRIEVNNELSILADAIKVATAKLAVGGRLVVITFHSLEDRIVKQTIKELSMTCICPPQLPICTCDHKAILKVCGKVIKPSQEEIKYNSRARSAKLRIAEKI